MEIEKDEEEFQRIAYTLPLPFPKKRKDSNEKILFKRAFPKRLVLNQSFPKSKKKKKKQNKTITKLAHLNNKV